MNTREEQEYFYDMFNEMWGEKMPEQDQYCLSEELAKIERVRINDALDRFEGNQTKAAQSLNIGRTALIAKMKKYKLN